MFREEASYFRKIAEAAVKQRLQEDAPAVYRDLLKALESARTRLAIAIAGVTKVTPIQRWNYYLETSDQMRRCLKQLRAHPRPESIDQPDWIKALDTLREMPARPDLSSHKGEADVLCRRLRSVLGRLGQFEK